MKVVSAPIQVVIRGEFSAEGEASEVLAIDDLSFSPGCLTAPGPVTPQPLTCSTDQFQCAYSFQCIPKNFWCDKEPNCADQSDEEHCPAFVPGTIPPQLLCLIGFYQCSDSLCLPSILRCDGVPDCPDGDDEYSCRKYLCVFIKQELL
ncbi:MAM and LDL-receptor class A domain-containing protein 1-like [Hippoglossus stenolepis]|uniref:MAM and LDL-receptor class A domain-containing protein 1-like n=1 Tax=Hippoglossus stenolepis TaxID=195615 RepID=UPI001FAEE246|nr:MAM and LDL-receptor class A domain-containing protein 1-like [Hippoglossus stenolepis]